MESWLAVLLVGCPLLLAGVTFAVPSNRWRPWLLPLTAVLHLGLTAWALAEPEVSALGGWLLLDPLGKVFLGFVSVLFCLCAWYAPAYLRLRPERSNRVFCSALLLTLAMMTLVILSHHLGLLWVAMEATTLATAPCLYFNHNPRSLEATWKYLLLCSVGIALALFGTFFLAYAAIYADLKPSLLLDDLVRAAPQLGERALPWLQTAFVVLFVGYGTKMGLAPMHTWKPDAYGEAPGLMGAILAGALINCAFLAILRIYHVTAAAGAAAFAGRIMVVMGLVSMGLAALSMARQRDIKRLLAYSSVEHMGILVFGIGLGGPAATLAALWHVLHNGLTKGVLFLAAGNIHRAYGSKQAGDLSGVLERLPFSGAMFLAGFFAITASPPFAPFVSEFQILQAAFHDRRYAAGGLYLLFLFLVFIGMGLVVLSICQGKPSTPPTATDFRDNLGTGLPILVFLGLVVLLGVYNPPPLTALLQDAANYLHGAP
jgi:hydrogenase-4 component F